MNQLRNSLNLIFEKIATVGPWSMFHKQPFLLLINLKIFLINKGNFWVQILIRNIIASFFKDVAKFLLKFRYFNFWINHEILCENFHLNYFPHEFFIKFHLFKFLTTQSTFQISSFQFKISSFPSNLTNFSVIKTFKCVVIYLLKD